MKIANKHLSLYNLLSKLTACAWTGLDDTWILRYSSSTNTIHYYSLLVVL